MSLLLTRCHSFAIHLLQSGTYTEVSNLDDISTISLVYCQGIYVS
jgi:hypothetical protein